MLWRSRAPKRQPPGFIEPCIPTLASRPPVGPDWIHEIKHDGYRLIVRKKDDRVRLFTRRGSDWTDRFPLIRQAVASLRPNALVLDGEAVCCDPDGVANFEKLHSQAHNDRVFLYAFDLLELGGIDLRPDPLEERRGRLQYLLRRVVEPGVQFNEHIIVDGATIFAHACRLGFEGIVSKHRQSAYRAGPSEAWLEIKNPSAPGVLRFKDEAEP
jgi:bifunctional non-homologous end joining protein LigD